MLCLCDISNNQSNPIKAKDHLQALERHIKMWGFFKGLLYEGMSIQQRFRSKKKNSRIVKI